MYNNVQSNRMSEKANKLTEQLMLDPNKWIEKWAVDNESKSFFNKNWEEKIDSQLYDGMKENLKLLPEACKTEDTQHWLDLKMSASKHAISKIVQWMHNMTCSDDEDDEGFIMYDSDDDGDDYQAHKKDEHLRNHNKVVVSKEDVCLFLYQLQYNVVFDMGFKIKSGAENGQKRCYCPCGNAMKNWRKEFYLGGISGKGTKIDCSEGRGKANYTANDFLEHCRQNSIADCPIHYGIHAYVNKIHNLYISSKGKKTDYEAQVTNYVPSHPEEQSFVKCTNNNTKEELAQVCTKNNILNVNVLKCKEHKKQKLTSKKDCIGLQNITSQSSNVPDTIMNAKKDKEASKKVYKFTDTHQKINTFTKGTAVKKILKKLYIKNQTIKKILNYQTLIEEGYTILVHNLVMKEIKN